MNDSRRKEIQQAIKALGNAQVILECMHEDEQEYYDNMPEELQGREKGEEAEAAIENLAGAIRCLKDIVAYAEEACF